MKKIFVSIAALGTLAVAGTTHIPVPAKPIPIPEPTQNTNANNGNIEDLPLGLYLGGGLTYAHSDCKCKGIKLTNGSTPSSSKSNTYGVNLKAGYDFNNYIGIEAKYIHTPWGDDNRALKHYGLYLKPNYAVNKNIDLYGLLGYGKTLYECTNPHTDKKGFALGLGGEYTVQEKANKKKGIGIYAEYLRPLKKSGSPEIKSNIANVGVAYHY